MSMMILFKSKAKENQRKMRSFSWHSVSYWSQSNLISFFFVLSTYFFCLSSFLFFVLLLLILFFSSLIHLIYWWKWWWCDNTILVYLFRPSIVNIMHIQFNQSESQLDWTSWFMLADFLVIVRGTDTEEEQNRIFYFFLFFNIDWINLFFLVFFSLSIYLYSILFIVGNWS